MNERQPSKKLTRREFLGVAGRALVVTIGGAAVASCGGGTGGGGTRTEVPGGNLGVIVDQDQNLKNWKCTCTYRGPDGWKVASYDDTVQAVQWPSGGNCKPEHNGLPFYQSSCTRP